jgi:hypothetical protein
MRQFLLTFLALSACSFSRGQKQDRLLQNAWQSNSTKKLGAFFDTWAREITPLSAKELAKQSDTIQNVYLVFRAFYNPLKTGWLHNSEWGNNFYKKAEYLVLPANICFALVDTLDKDTLIKKEYARIARKLKIPAASVAATAKTSRTIMKLFRFDWPEPARYDTIHDFRPQVSFETPKTVVLTNSYDFLLDSFLGHPQASLGAGSIITPLTSEKEIENRRKFLEEYIRTWYRTRTGHWQLLTEPFVYSIILDKAFKNALVNYGVPGEGDYAWFKKIDGVWTLMESALTWVE